jgi:hypothetical protein
MIDPSINANPDFNTLEKRCLMVGLIQMAEESGCIILDAHTIRKAVFPMFPNITDEQVDGWISDFIADRVIWPYVADDHATQCGYLPDWVRWNGRLARYMEPAEVPLPTGVVFLRYDPEKYKKYNRQGQYARPASKAALDQYPIINPAEFSNVIIPGVNDGESPSP